MKRIVVISAGIVSAIFAVLAIVPAAIDWNGYRDEIATRASHALGRTVELRGDIGVSLIPAPTVTVHDAHLANIEGAQSADTLSLDSVEIRISWAPLLIGSVRVDSIKLVRPVLNIEVFADGKTNLAFEPKPADDTANRSATARARAPNPASPGAGAASDWFDLSVQNFTIENGAVYFRDDRAEVDERIEGLNGRVALAGLNGPADVDLVARVHGVPVRVDASIGEIIQGRTVPFSLDAVLEPSRTRIQFSGSVNELDAAPRLRGRISLEGDNLRDALSLLVPKDAASMPRRMFAAQANLEASAERLEIADLTIKLDGAQGHGHVSVQFDAAAAIDASLRIGHLDLDALLRAPDAADPSRASRRAPGAPISATPPASPSSPAHDMALTPKQVAESVSEPARSGGFFESLPVGLTANLALAVEGITLRGSAIRQAKLDVSLANRELTVSQLSALLPGNSDVAAFGFVTERDGTAQFDGTIEAASSDLRALLEWLGIPLDKVAPGRLRAFSTNAKLSARRSQVLINELDARVDATKITGALTAAFEARPSFGVNLVADQVNVDAYLPADGSAAAAQAVQAGDRPATPAPGSPSSANGGTVRTGDALALLGAIDANVRLRLANANYRGVSMSDLLLDAALSDGRLSVRTASIADAMGVTASLSGAVGGIAERSAGLFDPVLSDVVFKAEGKSLVNLFRAAAVKSPVSAQALGPVSVSTRLGGSLRALDVIGDINAMGGRFSYDGRIATRDLLPKLEARLSLAHPDFAQLIRGFGVDYRPRGAKGPVALDATLAGGLFEIGLSRLSGAVAGVKLQGSGAARLPYLGGSVKPLVVLKLVTNEVDVDSFLPAKRTAALMPRGSIQPAAWRGSGSGAGGFGITTIAAASPAPWSSDPLDLSILGALDGSFSLKSDALTFDGIRLARADIDLELQKGVLEVRRLTGETLGGELTVDGRLQGDAIGGRFEARYALTNLDVSAADGALGARQGTPKTASGEATLEGRLAGTGSSLAALVASLDGEGALALRGLGGALERGSIFAALGGLARSLEQLGGLRGKLEPVPVTVTGPYRIAGGVVGFDELSFVSPIGEGSMKGSADLPKWQIAATGEIRLGKDFVIGGAQAKPIPFAMNGRLDAPSFKIDIAALPGGGLQLPLDKLRTRKGVGEVLKGLLPKAPPKRQQPEVEVLPPPSAAKKPAVDSKAPSAAQPSPPASEKQAPETKGTRVEDILKDILRGVSR